MAALLHQGVYSAHMAQVHTYTMQRQKCGPRVDVTLQNSIAISTLEYGYLSFMFDLSTPGTGVCKMCMKECGGLRIE